MRTYRIGLRAGIATTGPQPVPFSIRHQLIEMVHGAYDYAFQSLSSECAESLADFLQRCEAQVDKGAKFLGAETIDRTTSLFVSLDDDAPGSHSLHSRQDRSPESAGVPVRVAVLLQDDLEPEAPGQRTMNLHLITFVTSRPGAPDLSSS